MTMCWMTLRRSIQLFPDLQDLLERALVDEPPVLLRNGGVIADGL